MNQYMTPEIRKAPYPDPSFVLRVLNVLAVQQGSLGSKKIREAVIRAGVLIKNQRPYLTDIQAALYQLRSHPDIKLSHGGGSTRYEIRRAEAVIRTMDVQTESIVQQIDREVLGSMQAWSEASQPNYEVDPEEIRQLEEADKLQETCPRDHENTDPEDGCIDCGYNAK